MGKYQEYAERELTEREKFEFDLFMKLHSMKSYLKSINLLLIVIVLILLFRLL